MLYIGPTFLLAVFLGCTVTRKAAPSRSPRSRRSRPATSAGASRGGRCVGVRPPPRAAARGSRQLGVEAVGSQTGRDPRGGGRRPPLQAPGRPDRAGPDARRPAVDAVPPVGTVAEGARLLGRPRPLRPHPGGRWLHRPRHNNEQPWALLHELSHAYHDQVLGFEDACVRRAYDHYKASGHGDSVLHISGHRIVTTP